MKKKTIQRCISMVMVCVILPGLFTGCGRSKETGSTLTVNFEHSYTSEELEVGNGSDTSIALLAGDLLVLHCYDRADKSETYYSYTPGDGEVKELQFDFMESLQEGDTWNISAAAPNAEGGVTILFDGYRYETNAEGEKEFKRLGKTLECYDSQMKLLESEKVDDDLSFQNITLAQDGTYYASQYDIEAGKEIIYTLDEHFQIIKEVASIRTDGFIFISALKDGIYVTHPDHSGIRMECGKLNETTGKIETVEIEGMPQRMDRAVVSTANDQALYLYDETSVYEIRPGEAVCEEVLNWSNSDFMGEKVEGVYQLSDGRFALTYRNASDNGEVWILSPREGADPNIISLATLGLPEELNYAVTQYNRSQDKNRIVIYDYSQFDAPGRPNEAGLVKFKTDMTSGIVADIINTDGIPYESFCNKGIFMDLTDYMRDMTEDKYFTNFFQSLAFGDKLYRIGFDLEVSTMLAKTEFVGDAGGKTLDEMQEIMEGLPEDMDAYQEMTKGAVLDSLVTKHLEAFIDRDTGSCNFDSPGFVELLAYCDQFDLEDSADDQYDEFFWYVNDEVLFYPQQIWNVKDSYQDRFIYFNDTPVTMFGLPVVQEEDNGGRFETDLALAICSESKVKEECWQFFEMMLSDDFQMNMTRALPVSKTAFDALAQEQMIPIEPDENGNEPYHILTPEGQYTYSTPPMPQSYVDEIKTYISNIRYSSYYDAYVYNIVEEEAEKLFAGDQTAQQAADMIQKRASLYLSEQG